MDFEKNTEEREAVDHAAYGGSRYRLSYDKYQGAVEKIRSNRTSIAAVCVVTVVLLFLGFLIYRYFDGSFRRYFSGNGDSMGTGTANFQSYHGAVTDGE